MSRFLKSGAQRYQLAFADNGGIQATVLAERAGMTKQAAGRVIADLEREGYVRRQPDRADQRASKIVFTNAGRQFLADAYHLKREIEAEYAVLLGEDRWREFRSILQQLLGDA